MRVNLSRIKWIEAVWGPEGTAALLDGLSSRIDPVLRRGDICGHSANGHLTIWLPNVTKREAHAIANDLSAAVAQHEFHLQGGAHVAVRCNVGIGWARDAKWPQQVIDLAGKALIKSQQSGFINTLTGRMNTFDEGIRMPEPMSKSHSPARI